MRPVQTALLLSAGKPRLCCDQAWNWRSAQIHSAKLAPSWLQSCSHEEGKANKLPIIYRLTEAVYSGLVPQYLAVCTPSCTRAQPISSPTAVCRPWKE